MKYAFYIGILLMAGGCLTYCVAESRMTYIGEGVATRIKTAYWNETPIDVIPDPKSKGNEDRPFCIYDGNPGADYMIVCGIVDGHGGAKAAEFVQQKFLPKMGTTWKEQTGLSIQPGLSFDIIQNSIRDVFEKFDQEFLNSLGDEPTNDGTTLSAIFIPRLALNLEQKIAGDPLRGQYPAIITNVGDSPVFVLEGASLEDFKVAQLTEEDHVTNPGELDRLIAYGLKKEVLLAEGRVVGFENTRSIGDYKGKREFKALLNEGKIRIDPTLLESKNASPLLATPHVRAYSFRPTTRAFMLMSDGVPNAIQNILEWQGKSATPEKVMVEIGRRVMQAIMAHPMLKRDDVQPLTRRMLNDIQNDWFKELPTYFKKINPESGKPFAQISMDDLTFMVIFFRAEEKPKEEPAKLNKALLDALHNLTQQLNGLSINVSKSS